MANKIVYASDAYVNLKSTINDMSSTLINFSHPPAGPADRRLLEFAQLIRPWTYEGLELIRVGGDHDGGYIMANDFNVFGAISIGVGADVSWDKEIASRGVSVAMFDPTVRKPPERIDGGRFQRIGIGPSDAQMPYVSLAQIVELAGMKMQDKLLLKIDVEGAEWQALNDLSSDALECFTQILIEFHGLRDLSNPQTCQTILNVVQSLAVGHLPVHVHANNYEVLAKFDRYWFPNAVEVSYVHRSLAKSPRKANCLSSELDRACDSRTSEVSLSALASLD